jgi:opacity protein-like surface antigen
MRRFALAVGSAALAAALVTSSAAGAAEPARPGFEIGARTGYAFSAGHLGAPPNGTDNNLGDYVGGQWPLWLDAGYRFDPALYLGAFFQYGFGVVNDDQQNLCRNANVDCSASDVRLGLMGRYNFAPYLLFAPWAGLGIGYEWGGFSLHQSLLGNSDTDSSWSGFEFANLQAGADYRVSPQFTVAPFASVSIGQFQSTSTTTVTGMSSMTNSQDLAKKSLHEWIMIGARVSFSP